MLLQIVPYTLFRSHFAVTTEEHATLNALLLLSLLGKATGAAYDIPEYYMIRGRVVVLAFNRMQPNQGILDDAPSEGGVTVWRAGKRVIA